MRKTVFALQILWGSLLLAENATEINVRDPFITVDREAGEYRLYLAKPWFGGTDVSVRKSKDLKDWSEPEKVMTVKPEWGVTAVWAPEVHEYDGRFWLFVTLTQKGRFLESLPGRIQTGEIQKRGTWVFSSAKADGPFVPVKEDSVTPPEWSCLDGTLWVEGGAPYIVFCHEWSQVGDGKIMAAKLKRDLSGLAEEPVELFRASVQAPKGYTANPKRPHLGMVTDGPFVYRSIHSNRLFMIWSGCPVDGGYPTYICESQTGSVVGPWIRHRTLTGRGGHAMLFHDLNGLLQLSAHYPNNSPMERMNFVRIDDSSDGLFEYPSRQNRQDKFDRIQVNQAGYLPKAAKVCFCEAPPKLEFRVQRLDEETGKRIWHDVFTGRFRKVARTASLYEGDFSDVTRDGDYRIVCGAATPNSAYGPGIKYEGVLSEPFDIREGVYDSAIRSFLNYYLWQRCGSKKGWAGVCHQEKCPLVDSDGRQVGELDARGGYHQSCDLRNWADGISLSVFNLLRYAETGAPRWDEGELEEELRWGIDYFYRISTGADYVYDSQFVPIGWAPRRYYARPAPYGAQANTVMLFARAARFFGAKDPAYAAKLLDRAKRIFAQMETNPFFDKAQPSGELPLPGGTQPWETWYQFNYRTTALGFTQRGSAALELYRTTNDAKYAVLAKDYGREAIRREAAGEKIEVNCGYSRALSGTRLFLELTRDFGEGEWKRAAIQRAEEIVALSKENCGVSLIYQGTASVGFMTQAVYLLEAAEVLGRPEWRRTAQRQVDFVFGANPDNSSLIDGIGYHQVRRPVFGQFYPSTPQIPGAVLHRVRGEYDMPPVSWTLLAVRMLEE